MTRRLLVNDALSQLGERTFWRLLMEWFGMEFVGGDYATLAEKAKVAAKDASLIARNATWFPPIEAACPQVSLLQDISPDGETRKMQEAVIKSSAAVVYNSAFTATQYPNITGRVIPLPVDFSLFEPQNALGCQQALSLPEGCVCWIGASQGAAGIVKGFDVFLQIVRTNPDIPFVGVFKDAPPESVPPNLRCYARLPQAELVKVIGACRVGLCTSRTESQHLAGIEMGGVGLPLVVPPVGIYWETQEAPIRVVTDSSVGHYTEAIRATLSSQSNAETIRAYWKERFDLSVVRLAWETLIREVEQ